MLTPTFNRKPTLLTARADLELIADLKRRRVQSWSLLCPASHLPAPTSCSLAPVPASAMNARTHLKNALAKGDAGVGMWLTYVPLALLALVLIADHPVLLLSSMPGTAHARTIATVPGFNWFLVDAEHGQITDANYSDVRLVSSVRTDRIGPSTDRLSLLAPFSALPRHHVVRHLAHHPYSQG